jgi:hypothetical protein
VLQQTRDLLHFLHKNPIIRSNIKAPPDATLLYVGGFMRSMWLDIQMRRHPCFADPAYASKWTLADALRKIPTPGQHPTLEAWALHLDRLEPFEQNGYVAWRALSGIFCANAMGKVSFCVGTWDPADADPRKRLKVFPVTEIPVLLRNPRIDPTSRQMLEFYDRCVKGGQAAINVGYIAP